MSNCAIRSLPWRPSIGCRRFIRCGSSRRPGGLPSYGPDVAEEYRQAAGYVDRVLRGEKPANLPVQVASKYQLVINLKTAKSLNLAIPQTLLATADEVLE